MYYTKDTILFLNGKFIKAMDAHTDLYSQTLHYGYGAFEGIRAYQTMNGVKIFKANEHFERLKKSFGRAEALNPQALGFEIQAKRVEHGLVVVDEAH